MYKLEQTDYGIKATVQGFMDPTTVTNLRSEFVLLLAQQDGPFSLLVDARDLIPPEPESANLLQDCEEMASKAGMQRMAIILKSPVVKVQMQQVGHLSGAGDITRHIDASKVENAEEIALAWVVDGVEPEPTQAPIDGQSQTT